MFVLLISDKSSTQRRPRKHEPISHYTAKNFSISTPDAYMKQQLLVRLSSAVKMSSSRSRKKFPSVLLLNPAITTDLNIERKKIVNLLHRESTGPLNYLQQKQLLFRELQGGWHKVSQLLLWQVILSFCIVSTVL